MEAVRQGGVQGEAHWDAQWVEAQWAQEQGCGEELEELGWYPRSH